MRLVVDVKLPLGRETSWTGKRFGRRLDRLIDGANGCGWHPTLQALRSNGGIAGSAKSPSRTLVLLTPPPSLTTTHLAPNPFEFRSYTSMPSLRSGKPCRKGKGSLRPFSFPFLSLPLELRLQTYSYLWRERQFASSPWGVYFEANEYGNNSSILFVNQQIRDEALCALYRDMTIAVKIHPEIDPHFEDMITWGFSHLRKVELKFEMQDWVLHQGYPLHFRALQESEISLENYQGRITSLAETLFKMPALQTVILTWEEPLYYFLGHVSKKCLLGCQYPGGVPKLNRTDKHAISWQGKARQKYVAINPRRRHLLPEACPTEGLVEPKQRVDHYWEQVLLLQKLISQVLEPLRGLPATVSFQKGPIDLYCGRPRRNAYTVERGILDLCRCAWGTSRGRESRSEELTLWRTLESKQKLLIEEWWGEIRAPLPL